MKSAQRHINASSCVNTTGPAAVLAMPEYHVATISWLKAELGDNVFSAGKLPRACSVFSNAAPTLGFSCATGNPVKRADMVKNSGADQVACAHDIWGQLAAAAADKPVSKTSRRRKVIAFPSWHRAMRSRVAMRGAARTAHRLGYVAAEKACVSGYRKLPHLARQERPADVCARAYKNARSTLHIYIKSHQKPYGQSASSYLFNSINHLTHLCRPALAQATG